MNKLMSLITAVLAVLALSLSTLADTLHLKDGRVLEGTVVREGDGFIFFRVKVGTIEQNQLFTTEQIEKLVRSDTAPKTDEAIKAKADEAKKAEEDKAKNDKHSGATRIAILNFGPPSSWQGSAGNMVGVQVSAEGFKKAIPLLEKAKVDVVVVRVNSGGGYGLEVPKFNEIFELYETKFRTVAWIESAISAAAMSPWVIEEMYFLPQGNIGACTGWYGNLVAVKGLELEEALYKMEKASALGKKDPKIMRAMQIMEPLSVDFDESGNPVWRQDDQGELVLNPKGKVYTMNAEDGVKTKFAKGIAATEDELAKAMGLQEYEIVALDASALVDKNIRDNDAVEKRAQYVYAKYSDAINLAAQLQDKKLRGAQLAIAKRHLAELRKMIAINPNFEFHIGMTKEWFEEQEEIIKRLSQGP